MLSGTSLTSEESRRAREVVRLFQGSSRCKSFAWGGPLGPNLCHSLDSAEVAPPIVIREADTPGLRGYANRSLTLALHATSLQPSSSSLPHTLLVSITTGPTSP